MYESILVATDGSDGARAAAREAIDLADALGATLYGVAVVESRTDYDLTVLDPEEVTEPLRERADRALADLESAAGAAGVSLETERRTGAAHEAILAVADDRDVDLVVIGGRGRSSFRRALLGSTADAVVRLASVPVVVVGDGEGEATAGDGTDDEPDADAS